MNELKRLIQENDCDKCELCSKILTSENDVTEHSCDGESMAIETMECETPEDILEANTSEVKSELSLKNQVVPLRYISKLEPSAASPDIPNAPDSMDSINVTENQQNNHRCMDLFFKMSKT